MALKTTTTTNLYQLLNDPTITAQDLVNALQYDVLAETTENNPNLPSTGLVSKRRALTTDKKYITGAINDADSSAKVAITNVNGFADRFANCVGNEMAFPDLLENFKNLGYNNLLSAVVQIHEKIEEYIVNGPDTSALEARIAQLEAQMENTIKKDDEIIFESVNAELTQSMIDHLDNPPAPPEPEPEPETPQEDPILNKNLSKIEIKTNETSNMVLKNIAFVNETDSSMYPTKNDTGDYVIELEGQSYIGTIDSSSFKSGIKNRNYFALQSGTTNASNAFTTDGTSPSSWSITFDTPIPFRSLKENNITNFQASIKSTITAPPLDNTDYVDTYVIFYDDQNNEVYKHQVTNEEMGNLNDISVPNINFKFFQEDVNEEKPGLMSRMLNFINPFK